MTQYTLTSSWQKVASAGQTVEIQNLSVEKSYLSTSSGTPADQSSITIRAGDNHRTFNLSQDLYACCDTGKSVTIEVMTGLSAGGGTSSSVTVTNFPATQPISVSALPLPSGASQDGVDATGVTMPSGGSGIRGWLSGIFSKMASLVTTSTGTAARIVLVDPSTGNGSLVQAFHNADNQSLGATAYGLMTGGVDQLLNSAGNLDRKRAVSGDAMASTGLSAEVSMLWNGASYDRAPGNATSGMKAQLASGTAQIGSLVDGNEAPSFPASLSGTGVFSGAGIATSGFNSVVLILTGTSGGTTIVAEAGDGTNWFSQMGTSISSNGAGSDNYFFGSPGSIMFPVTAAYIRFRISSYGGTGTVTADVRLRTAHYAPRSVYVGGGAVTANQGSLATQSITPTVLSLSGSSQTLIAANSSRKSLRWMNLGSGSITVSPVSPVVAGSGMIYDPGTSTSNQGGGSSFGGEPVPTGAFYVIGTAGAKVVVWEGN